MPTTYPLDLTGVAPSNLVTNELHTFSTAASRFFIPSAGPFFTIGLVVRHGVTNVLLQPDTQYKILHLHREASLASGKEVCAIIVIVDPAIPSVLISYQVIGGIYSDTASVIQDLLDNNPIDPSDMVSWQNIFGAPVQFPPTEHLHHFDNIYGAEELVAVLERLRMAIAAGDSPAISAIYQYIHTLLTNLNYTTEQDVIDLIGGDPVQYVKTYDTYADLRTEVNAINDESYLYIATGKATLKDRKGRIFMWDITSTADDDNDMVLRPHPIPPTNPGRFVSMLGVETELRDALATIGRKIDEDGNILTDLQATFPLETVDLDDVINSGVYWVKPDCTNKPAGNTQGHLFVEKNDIYVVQRFISTVQDDRNMVGEGDTNITVPTAHTFNRVGRLVGGNYVWEDWRGLIDRDTLNIALQSLGRKIDEDFKVRSDLVNGTNNTFTGDLNTLIQPGPWYVAPTSTNMPIGAERGTVDVLQSGIFISQTFSSIIQEYDITDVSQTVTNGPDVIRPTVFKRILTLNANLDTVDTVGEWISFIDLPTVNRALKTLGRKIEDDFTITTDYAAIGLSVDGDLNDVRDVGHYWVTPTATNKPAGAFDGYLTVINTDIWYTQIYISVFHDVDYLNLNPSTAGIGAAKVFIRNGYFTPGNPAPWQPWQPIVDLDTINNALATIGRKIEDDFTINTNIFSFITPLTGSTNLNDIVKPGIYPLMADADNSTPHSNWPLGVYRGIMIVESTYLGGVSTEFQTFQEIITSYDNDEQGDPVGQNPFFDGTIKPTVYRRVKENNSWTGWFKTLDSQDALRHGLTTQGIATRNTVPALTWAGSPTDLNTYTMPGKYWVGTGIVNSAFNWGILEVELVGGTATESGEVIQTMRSPQNNGRYSQRMRYWDAPFSQYVWSDWITLAMQNGDSAQFFEASYPAFPTPYHVINGAKLAIVFAALWTTLKRYGIEEAVVHNYVGDTVNLNTITTPGTFWFSNNQTNRPFDYGILEVLLMSGTIDSPNEIHQRAYWDGREAIRFRDYSGNWQPWYYIKTKDLVNERNLSGVGLNGVILPGDYYYTITTNDRPSNYGLVTVRRENEDIVYQEAHSSENDKYIRYRYSNGTWTPWQRLVKSSEITSPPKNGSLGYSAYDFTVPGSVTVTLTPGEIVRLLVWGGAGGGADYGVNGGNGGNSEVWWMGEVIARGFGGQGGFAGYATEESGVILLDDPVRSLGDVNRELGFHIKLNGINNENDLPSWIDGTSAAGLREPWTGSDMVAIQSNGGRGGLVDLVFCNPMRADITITCIVGAGGYPTNTWFTAGGDGRIIVLRGR